MAKKKPKLPDTTILGVYRLGHRNVQVVLDWMERGGAFYFCPSATELPRIRIGMDYDQWEGVVNVALHEALEAVLCDMEVCFRRLAAHTSDTGDRLFSFDHSTFTEAVARVSSFCAALLPALATEFRKRKKK